MGVSAFLRGVTAISCFAFAATLVANTASAQAPEPEALKALIAQAKKEPNAVSGSMTRVLLPTPALIQRANRMFNKAFGLNKPFPHQTDTVDQLAALGAV